MSAETATVLNAVENLLRVTTEVTPEVADRTSGVVDQINKLVELSANVNITNLRELKDIVAKLKGSIDNNTKKEKTVVLKVDRKELGRVIIKELSGKISTKLA